MKLILAVYLVFLTGCAASTTTERPAVLEGKITIGPLMPVVREGDPVPTVPADLYRGRKVQLFDPDGTTLVQDIPVNDDGSYRAEVAPGTYIVSVSLSGIEYSKDVPTIVRLAPRQAVRVNIDIDTGIR